MAFSFRAGTNWCHDFPKLARESGFYFNMHSVRVRVDWNRISAIDIDKVIRERDFSAIDENINNVIDYCLESEYDIKILDPSFVKLFRLAQLSVEYLLYCKQYLDHSVIILKDELRQKIEQNVNMKKEMTTLEDSIKNLKERSREKCKLIETRVGDSSGEIYKCPHCPKTFVSAMFVNAHVARRHLYISDMRVSVSPMHEHYRTETEKLHNEIKTLKERLNETERVIKTESDKLLDNAEKNYVKNTSEYKYDNKIESIQEQRKYEEDIKSLKSMLFDEIRAMREKEHNVNENISEANIKTLITQQEKEIESLKNQLLQTLTPGIENMEMKLQMQESYWKAKIENMESQHRKDIERLTTELKTAQQAADCIKSEYTSKVYDLEKKSMDQSNMLVEQRKQLNYLSREITNSQTYDDCYEKEKSTMHSFQRSLLKKRGNADFYDNEVHHKNLSRVENDEIIIEDIGSESSQEYNENLSDLEKKEYNFGKTDNLKSRNNAKLIGDASGTEHMIVKSNRKDFKRLENNGKIKDKVKSFRILKDINEVNHHEENIKDVDQSKTFTVKNLENVSLNANNEHVNIRNTERKEMSHIDDMKNSQKFKFLVKRSVSSITESESVSSTSASDTGSITMDDITVKKDERTTVSFPNSKKISQENVLDIFNNRLRDLGIDPEWQGIPIATFKQKMEILKHQQNINSKKLTHYNQIKQEILTAVLRKISANHNELKNTTSIKIYPSRKLVTHLKPKALKAFNSHKNNDEALTDLSTQKLENTTPTTTPKLRFKQKIDLLPKKYKENMTSMHASSMKKDWIDMCNTPKVTSTLSKLSSNSNVNQDASSTNSIDSREDIKHISSTKIIVSDNTACKLTSPMNKRHFISSKSSENDSDSIILPQEDSVVSSKDNKSVLKLTSGSTGSLVKKKVLFDIEDEKNDIPKENEKRDQLYDNDWDISSFSGENGYSLQKEKFINTGNIVLKTAQSNKIAEISKKIQEQLRIARRPPIGSVETIICPSMDLEDTTNYNAQTANSTGKLISGNPTQDFARLNAKSSIFPQPAPRTLKDKDHTITHHENNTINTTSKYFDLDSDIEEILRIV